MKLLIFLIELWTLLSEVPQRPVIGSNEKGFLHYSAECKMKLNWTIFLTHLMIYIFIKIFIIASFKRVIGIHFQNQPFDLKTYNFKIISS